MQLVACRDRARGVVVPASVTSSYSKIAYIGLGWTGVFVTDASIFVTLFGVCVSTMVNVAALLHDMLGNYFQLNMYILLTAMITYPLTCLKNMSTLARLSPIGIVCLALNVGAIVGYGISLYWSQLTGIEVAMWPQSPPDLASYTGIAIFCFGLCTLALQIEESMEHSSEFPLALFRCLVIVCAVYFFVGDIVALLYSHDARGVSGNILLNLPDDAIISTFSRVAMIAVTAFL
jgi:amino acid permease